ncbi:MAG: YjbH domain-containing protein [Smithellaceae bacterium]|nr:YjbH domain-containing protein [Smithellaceae bacterium]
MLFPQNLAFAGDAPFTSPNNWGATGLMETPTARVLESGTFRVGVGYIDPYLYYYGAVSPLRGLEIDGHITEVLGTETGKDNPAWKGYGNFKDKYVGLKYQFLREGKYWPALALGIMDPHGTRVYAGQYLVASKQIFPFDFTIGLGNGRFGKAPLAKSDEAIKVELFQNPREWWNDAQVFGGIEFHPTSWLSFMVEYNPIKYEAQTQDPARNRYFKDPVPSKINFGMRVKPFDWAQLDLSYQRGNQFGANLALCFNLDNQLIPIFDMPYKEQEQYRYNPLAERISRGLYLSGFRDIGVKISGSEIRVQAANVRYFYNMKAMGVLLKVLDQILPSEIQKIQVVLTERGIPMISFSTLRDDLRGFQTEVFKVPDFVSLSRLQTNVYSTLDAKILHRRYFDYGIKPEFQTFLNDPSGFFKGRAGVAAWVSLQPWKGANFTVGAEAYAWNDISSSVPAFPDPVRSDIVSYLEKDVAISNVMFEQILKTRYEIYGKVAAGLLEIEYAGLDAEMATTLLGGRILAGVGGSLVKKRDPSNPFKLTNNDWDDNYKTAFINTRVNFQALEMYVDVKAGRFLAGDKGARVTVTKSFLNGVQLAAWYSFTDTSIFTDQYNNGYHDKGISISIPLRLFLGRDSRTLYTYSISPWTRDVAQDIGHRTALFDFIGRNTNRFVHKDSPMIR